ncbi:glycerophosphoinositol transporter [Fusarium circinatum]|uniref:Glycerophosphoinositol transporter n=1 Tax=Fusarium circinatum TaxID=48490 RepID=A0A8H5X0M2_FUSCI|nr:glycerophosphoinositol transporter [Fusarium circinatum]
MSDNDKNEMPADKTLAVSSDASISADTDTIEPSQRTPGQLDVLVQGVALFSDGYNIQIIGYMNAVLAKLYPKQMTAEVKTRLSNSILIGDIFGMLLFGLCIDRFGRRVGIYLTTLFLVLGIIIATAAHGASVEGGEYTVCTSQAVECADSTEAMRKRRGMLVAVATNAAIISGFVASSIVSLIVIAAYKGVPHDGIWRICFGIGIVLPLGIFFFRLRLTDSTQYQRHAIQQKIPYKLAIKYYWKPLLGCCSAWFLYDAVVYPFNLLAPTLVAGFSNNLTMQESIGWSALINFFALPGAFIGALLMDRIGRRQTYALGWSIVCVFGFVIGGTMYPLNSPSAFPAFVTLYGLFQTFLSVGPGDCNFLVSSESFPTPLRGHFLGFAAAIGKVGAAVGTQALSKALVSFDDKLKGQQVVFLIGSAISVVGVLCVWFLIPNHPKTLEEEDVRFKAYLEENGYDTSQMGLKG